jgi:hypothetical protein
MMGAGLSSGCAIEWEHLSATTQSVEKEKVCITVPLAYHGLASEAARHDSAKKEPPGPCGPGGNYTFALLKFLD